ncbi:histidine phosphatase superfamily [Pseudomassariella vexata]|uniref:Histidine phosphatase superfamily n=1 Tax=Pseudomassariella vexata TaxID=1141098 RepID=A0A1Y2E078_9PEZI|nr:histidine phosphatase superfamily [Pseudomassariella vexata]ORY64275.1 histidine phosphatase superfamily [Pseudomassariella vexata]
MVITTMLLVRHGHRLSWILDPVTGKYSSLHTFPSGLPADPPLASHGVRQARETSIYLDKELAEVAQQGRLRIYSSLFYRCLETLRPTVERLTYHDAGLAVRGERGIGEWFGKAPFSQPTPELPSQLKAKFFPWVDDTYESRVVPDHHGERIDKLHDRIALALSTIVEDVDAEFNAAGRGDDSVTLVLSTHAAPIIAMGRVLTGYMPDDVNHQDFKCYTCGISKFVRRNTQAETGGSEHWRTNKGVAGGWDCVANSDCSHLSQGEERGWHFQGDETFDSYGPGMLITEDGGVSEKVQDTNESDSKL